MCWTITEPVPSGDGSFGISSPRAFGPPVEDAIRTNFLRVARGRTAAAARGGRPAAAGAAARRGAAAGARLPLSAASLTLLGELGGEVGHRLAHRRLGDEVERALGQRVDGAGAVGGGERRDHDDRDRLGLAGAQRAQHAEAVEAGHVQVERQRVGPVLVAGGQRLVAVGRAWRPRRTPDARGRRRGCGASGASRRRRRLAARCWRRGRPPDAVATRRRARRRAAGRTGPPG